MTRVRRVTFRSYAGPSIKGSEPWEIEGPVDHWARVLWLTSKVESGGKFGAITMYDGTAMTAGLHQAIAVYPKELRHEDFAAKDDQGSLWKLLRMIEMVPNFPELEELWAAFAEENWYVATDGKLRYLEDATVKVKSRNRRVTAGDMVYGFEIREAFTPNQGKTPARGAKWEQSKRWAHLFHAVFSNPKSFKAQTKFGQEHFHRYCRNKRIKASDERKSISEWLYEGRHLNPSVSTEELDLALAVLWSHSVNGPAIAWKLLRQTLSRHDPIEDPSSFSRDILRRLGRSNYGRWNHTVKNGRWARTRLAAMRSGMWSAELFKAGGIMPRSL